VVGISNFIVGLHSDESAVRAVSACANDELANTALRLRIAVRILRSKALVIVIVAIDNEIHTCRVENLAKWFHEQ
jgi:hypothetical protein